MIMNMIQTGISLFKRKRAKEKPFKGISFAFLAFMNETCYNLDISKEDYILVIVSETVLFQNIHLFFKLHIVRR